MIEIMIEEILKRKHRPVIIAIDGRCAAGKLTLALLLSEQPDATIFHMDDFYLQGRQSTYERLNEVGGNVDYERFAKEV